ncbi:hypothetical protein ACFFX0_07810 [Citricoccus parietis]|uniref:Uncharacterized protein n=1 Tax=Citricoccus parietis TaxID=592307 RepID=A0ABV5FWN3_9MICC
MTHAVTRWSSANASCRPPHPCPPFPLPPRRTRRTRPRRRLSLIRPLRPPSGRCRLRPTPGRLTPGNPSPGHVPPCRRCWKNARAWPAGRWSWDWGPSAWLPWRCCPPPGSRVIRRPSPARRPGRTSFCRPPP